jgi:hypothetical protein
LEKEAATMNTQISQDFRSRKSGISRLYGRTEQRKLWSTEYKLIDGYIKGMDILEKRNKRVIMNNLFSLDESIRTVFGWIGYKDSKKSRRLGQ